VPKVEHFLYKVLCESSKLLWGSTYLFSDSISSIEKQKNYRNVEGLLNEAVIQAVRAMVPVKSILKDFVSQDGEEEETEETEEKKPEPEDEDDAVAAALSGVSKLTTSETQMPEVKPEETKPEETKTPEAKPEETKSEETQTSEAQPNNELIIPQIENLETETQNENKEPPRIIINDRSQRSVSFSEFDTILDQDNPDRSDLYEQKEKVEPELDILDDEGVPLESDDIENLGDDDDTETIGGEIEMTNADYDVIV
jgi:hypothetical protein